MIRKRYGLMDLLLRRTSSFLYRRMNPAKPNTKVTWRRRVIILTIILSWPAALGLAATKGKLVKEGNIAFDEGDFAASANNYEMALQKDSESDIINFNLGTAFYKEGQYADAIAHLQKALLSEAQETQQRAYYNLGNSHFRLGQAEQAENPESTQELWESALKYYQQAMKMDGADEDAQFNHDLVKRKLEELKQQQQQNQENQEESENQEENESQDGQDGQQDKQQQQNQKKNQDQNQDQQQGEGQPQENQGEESQDQQSQPQNQGEDAEDAEQPSQGSEPQVPEEEEQQGEDKEGAQDQQQPQQGQQSVNAQQLTPKEAQMLLEQYQQSKEPKGLLNIQQRQAPSSPVLKDW